MSETAGPRGVTHGLLGEAEWLNALAGWWWADPVAALVMVPIIANEEVEAVRGETCDDGCA